METIDQLSDDALVLRLKRVAAGERRLSAQLARYLAEFDSRRLYAPLGYASLFVYCVQALGFSEPEAKLRIHAARSSAKHPRLLDMLERGETSLSAMSRLAPVLSEENRDALLEQAKGKTCREVELLVAAVEPGAAKRDVARAAAGNKDEAKPVAAERVRIALDASARFLEKLEQAQGLLRHRYPQGRYEEVLEAGLDALLERVDPARRQFRRRQRRARTSRARRSGTPSGQEKTVEETTAGRRIPQALRDQVWARDAGRCAFVGRNGRRCGARERLEIDHATPYAMGGETTLENLRVLCREHNQWLARQAFGACNVAQAILDRRRLRLDALPLDASPLDASPKALRLEPG